MKRNSTINFMRFFFALVIMLFHSYFWRDDNISLVFPIGSIAVEFFFIVSGYLVAMEVALNGGKDGKYPTPQSLMLHKIKKLILPVWCSWLIVFLVECIIKNKNIITILKDFLDNIYEVLFLRNAGFSGININGVTWYISAMLIAMAAISIPLFRRKEEYIELWAPLIAILLLGYLSHEYESIVNVHKWSPLGYKCQIRAIAEINLGIFIFGAVQRTKDITYTKLGKCFISSCEVICYTGAALYMQFAYSSRKDFAIIIFLAAAVLLSFSGKTYLYDVFNKIPKVTDFLGKWSLYIYLNQMLWIKVLPVLLPYATYFQMLILYIPLTLVTALLVMKSVDLLRLKVLPEIRKIMIAGN